MISDSANIGMPMEGLSTILTRTTNIKTAARDKVEGNIAIEYDGTRPLISRVIRLKMCEYLSCDADSGVNCCEG